MEMSDEEFYRVVIEESSFLGAQIVNMLNAYALENTLDQVPSSTIIVEALRRVNEVVLRNAVKPEHEDYGRRYLAGLDPSD